MGSIANTPFRSPGTSWGAQERGSWIDHFYRWLRRLAPAVPATVPVRTLITGPGGLRVGTGWAFRDPPLDGTLIVLHAYGPTQPWVLLTDTRYNPVIRRFYRRLCAVGKPKKVALIAAMRKLLTILNAMIKARKPWIEDHFPLLET